MKKKILIIVGIIIVVIIALILLIRNLGTTTKLAVNEVPMYGFATYEEYKAQRTPAIAKVDDDFVAAIVAKKVQQRLPLRMLLGLRGIT